jgi:DNA-binding CsgD family transcriptional regulator
VLDHTSKGLTNQEIASLLGLTVSTIKYYKTLAFRKVGARNRLEAIFAASKIAKQN